MIINVAERFCEDTEVMKNKKKIGIIGGMGPYASSHFYKLLLEKSSCIYDAKDNGDYPEIVIDSLPIFDFISSTDNVEAARRILIDRVRRLVNFGCDHLSVICNTAHIFEEDFDVVTKGKFVSMIDTVVEKVGKKGLKKVGVLATQTTVKSDIYGKRLKKCGVGILYPPLEMQEEHEAIIRSTIAGCLNNEEVKRFKSGANRFMERNVLEAVILGCTELPLVFGEKNGKVLDSMELLADELLFRYYK